MGFPRFRRCHGKNENGGIFYSGDDVHRTVRCMRTKHQYQDYLHWRR